MSTITPQEVDRIARLARLSLTKEQETHMAEQLSAVLTYVDKLGVLNTENIAPTNQVTEKVNATRSDVVSQSSDTLVDALQKLAPESDARGIKVPPILP